MGESMFCNRKPRLRCAGKYLSVALFLVPLSAQAQDWRPVERACAQSIDEQYGCTTACDNRLWPYYAACAIHQVYGNRVSQERFQAAVDRVWTERRRIRACELCGDPVRDVFADLGLK